MVATEYRVVTKTLNYANLSGPGLEEVLNREARDGWTYINMTIDTISNQVIFVFKMEFPERVCEAPAE